ncbi:Bicoid-interacting protein 3-domain-containing protein [Trametes gibbosa]|nr:Bicoid-interacting protein 3-domain-containing protein [Trametes gibbosa]
MTSKPSNIPVYGNYHGYYNKRPSAHDPRLALLPKTLFLGRRVLDVGCNEGWVTCEIAQRLGAQRVVGVDIDDTLIRAAWKHRRSVWSQQAPAGATPSTSSIEDNHPNGSRKRRRLSPSDDDDENVSRGAPEYFPASCEHMFGPLPIPAAASQDQAGELFPHNVTFRAADWVNVAIPDDSEGYDVVLAFSISKWIHLNCGDEGIVKFFERVHGVLKPGGTFILEPQEWETYAKAKRIDPKLKENAKNVKLRPDDFERILKSMGFGPAQHLGAIGEGGFRRPVDLYIKVS